MFNHSPFENDTIRKHVIVMGTLLNQIYFSRKDTNGDVVSMIRVPIAYGPRDKVLARRIADPNLDRPFSSILPFMTFNLIGMNHDPNRQMPKIGRFYGTTANKDYASWVHNPVPYDMFFDVNIIVKNVSDGWKIIEQILPWFVPDWTVTVKLIDEPAIALDIRTLIDPVNMNDNYSEGSIEDTRYVTWTLRFMMQGVLFGPPSKSKVIKRVETNLQYGTTIGDTYTQVAITPGLTANGEPTSNAAQSIAVSDIDWTDDYGYVETISSVP